MSVTPEDTHAYDIHYPGVEVTAGTVASADPSTNHWGYPVPAGTTFVMTGYQEVHDRRAEGWIIEVDSISGKLTVAAPEGAEGSVAIPLSVTYPDGSRDTTWVEVTATSAPKHIGPEGDDREPETPKPSDPGTPSLPQTGGSSFGSS